MSLPSVGGRSMKVRGLNPARALSPAPRPHILAYPDTTWSHPDVLPPPPPPPPRCHHHRTTCWSSPSCARTHQPATNGTRPPPPLLCPPQPHCQGPISVRHPVHLLELGPPPPRARAAASSMPLCRPTPLCRHHLPSWPCLQPTRWHHLLSL
jgi:hypothetical protein